MADFAPWGPFLPIYIHEVQKSSKDRNTFLLFKCQKDYYLANAGCIFYNTCYSYNLENTNFWALFGLMLSHPPQFLQLCMCNSFLGKHILAFSFLCFSAHPFLKHQFKYFLWLFPHRSSPLTRWAYFWNVSSRITYTHTQSE